MGVFGKRNKNGKKIILIIFILFLGIGFSLLSTQFKIGGSTSFKRQVWSVDFDNIHVNPESVSANLPYVDDETHSVLFSADLGRVGEYYEFTIDLVNSGTIDAVIKSVTKMDIAPEYADCIDFIITYADGRELVENDYLAAGDTVTYKVLVRYSHIASIFDIAEDNHVDLSFTVNYTQSSVKLPKTLSGFINARIQNDNSINFTDISSSENGNGIYVQTGTENSAHPIYYYRGDVNDNNAIFADLCWKIVRTTNTGGVKLLYNGEPDANGYCNNTGGSTQLSTTSAFNGNSNSPTYSGYMYGDIYTYSTQSLNSNDLYGESFSYENEIYTLTNTTTDTSDLSSNHYTCFNDTGTCNELYYIYYQDEDYVYYVTVDDSIDNILENMKSNTTSSTIKSVIDSWFNSTVNTYFTDNSKDYNDYLEDAVWCNDRSINVLGNDFSTNSGWIPNGGNLSYNLYYSTYGRIKSGILYTTCINPKDIFTVDLENGNGKLTYPVGLLTADEVVLAGGNMEENANYYLHTGQKWWTMTSYNYDKENATNFIVDTDGTLTNDLVSDSIGVRPVISVKSHIKIEPNGKGTINNPYIFLID